MRGNARGSARHWRSWTTGALALAAACSEPPTGAATATPDRPTVLLGTSASAVRCEANNAGLTLPSGFCAVIVAERIGIARHIAVRPNGDVYVTLNNGPGGAPVGAVVALRDANGDGYAETQQRFGSNGGSGIWWQNGFLWQGQDDRVIRWSLPLSDFVPSAGATTIVSGLPNVGDHNAKTVVLRRNELFVNIGSATNSCQVQNRVDFSPGIDPCPELAVRAGVWRYDANTPGQTHATAARFVTGTRNTNALAVDPVTEFLFGAQNGRDQLFDNWPTFYAAQEDAFKPAEEIFRLVRGHDYGWPYCYYDPIDQRKELNPEYGGNDAIVGRCANADGPVALLPAHWAPLGMTFYAATQFPAHYRNGLFIATHGSRFDSSQQPAGPGYNVVFIPFSGGMPSGSYEIFADNFARDLSNLPASAVHRPVGVAVGPDGSLYVTDDRLGFVYRILYVGGGTT